MNNNTNEYDSISSKESMKDAIHEIHNFLRNNGAGYGMNALKLFTLFYGLAKIEKNGHFKKTGLNEVCRFSKIVKSFNENKEISMDYLHNNILSEIYENDKVNNILVVDISENISPNTIKILVNKINNFVNLEKDMNFQLAGKIYEYFIGRDQTAISELGAYFTDRHITDYIYEDVHQPKLDKNNNVETMIDPFGGSGGFTLGYISHLNNKYKNIDWTNQLKSIYHMDMNIDVVKYAMLEMYCLTGEFPNKDNLMTINSFKDNFKNDNGEIKFKNIYTNPPYGGDKINKSETIMHMELIKKEIQTYLKKKYKINNIKKIISNKDIILKDKNKIKQYNYIIEKINIYEKERKSKTVSLVNSSKRFQLYAKENNIDITKCKDKESVSFLMMMDLLEKNGTAVGVLKEGLFFDNKYKHLRKHCIENFNIEKIISIDASQFENTSTKTSIIKFSNTGKTKKIKFYELVVEKEEKTEIYEKDDGTYDIKTIKDRIIGVSDKLVAEASYKDLVINDFTFNYKKYNIKELKPGKDYEMIRLSDLCYFLSKSKRKASFGKNEGKFNFYTSSKNIKKCDSADYDTECLIIGSGGNSCIHYCNFKFSCSTDTILLKYKNNTKYNYYILNCIWDKFIKQMNGSTIKHVTKSMLENIKLPVPKSDKKIKYWVDKINGPYNTIQESKKKLITLEEDIQNKIKKMLHDNDTEEVILSDLCNYIKTGKHISNRKGRKYPYYGTSKIICYIDNFMFDGKHIGIARKGDCIINYYDNKFTVNDDVILLKPNINVLYLYTYLNSNKNIFNYNGSTVRGIKKSTIENLKINIPKNRKLIDNLKPLFDTIDNLNNTIKEKEELYKNYLNELKNEAIINENTNNSKISNIKVISKNKSKSKKNKNLIL
jgi:restriction endonuclease S subunit/16S rRNA G966 N2-methylase RsmD